MGAIKPNNYTTEEVKIARISKALGHPARKKIITMLTEDGSKRNIDISNELCLYPSTVRDHIQFLKEAELINVIYFPHHYEINLNPVGFKLLIDFLDIFRN